MVSEIRFFKRRRRRQRRRTWTICENCIYLPLIHTSCDIFIHFLHAVTFSHVLHLDALRRQIELKLKVTIEISLCMAIMQNHPYIHSTTVLCDISKWKITKWGYRDGVNRKKDKITMDCRDGAVGGVTE